MIRVAAPALEPGEALRRLSRGARPFLLDGGCDADGLGGVSWAGCDPDDGVVWSRGDAGDPLALVGAAQRRWNAGPVEEFWPFAVGWISYDAGAEALVRACGRPPLRARDELGVPDVDFARYRAVWRRDNATGKCQVLALDGAAAAALLDRLGRTPPPLPSPSLGAPRWPTSDDEYRRRVGRVLEYLRAGDCYQVNLSHRMHATLGEHDALPLYLRLRALAPAPLGAYIAAGAATILCNSPESFLRVRPGSVETRPIKGTRRRGADADEDARLATELRGSAKDAAEHLMIVDLLRNDLGRVATTGSVSVDGFERLVTLPTVHHLVSTVRARTKLGLPLEEILRATLPGGSITGAPKLRAVEIIDELEGSARGPYCGAIGWLGAAGTCELALGIRTAVVRGGELALGVGGGIVADSDPDDELAETRVKAEAFLRALS
ncbi:MAG TPA: anthranilate synthase component I family protein [Polyangia bacterium]|jgi:para-aminobenzoate synthetase component 1